MYLRKYECDHALGYLVVEERVAIQVFDSFNSTLKEITLGFIVTFFEQIFDRNDDLDVKDLHRLQVNFRSESHTNVRVTSVRNRCGTWIAGTKIYKIPWQFSHENEDKNFASKIKQFSKI